MHYLQHILVLANCFFITIGTTADSLRYLKNNPIPALERGFSRSLYQITGEVQTWTKNRLALESGKGNLLFSPLGVDVLLATLLEGAQGEDSVLLTHLLGLDQVDGFPYCDVKIGYLQMLKNITSLLQMSTRLYIRNDFEVNQDFLSKAKDYYRTGTEMLNLTNKEEAAKTMNSYVKENTNHTIREVVTAGDISDDSTMVCISTMHFTDQWAFLFPKQVTSKQPFRPSPQTHSLVHMMHVKNKLHFVWNKTLKAKILALDFITKNVSMVFMLPDKEDALFDLEARLTSIDYVSLLRLVRSTLPVSVDLWVPRFTLRENLDVGKTLMKMGLTRLFTSAADLSGISPRTGLHVSKFKQNSHLVVGENGVEVSSTEVVETENGPREDYWEEFRADRPFLFFLLMEELVVFQGRVVNL